MGRTLLPFRPALESEIRSWNKYRQGLQPKERKIFDDLMNFARARSDAGSLAARPILSEVLFISMLVAQQCAIEDLKKKILKLKLKEQKTVSECEKKLGHI
ncbi:MAG: hypothetical protein ACTSYI_14670 [Promethearchaeota archaeon]